MTTPRDANSSPIEMTGATGSFDGEWFTEEESGAVRLSLRVSSRVHEETTPYQHLAVYDTPFFGKVLTLDNLIMLTERDEFVYHEMLTHVPLCTIPEPKSVLIIGGGDCGIIREVLRHRSVERVVQCEIDERVTRVSEMHFEWVTPTIADPRVDLQFADGIAYIERHTGEFDLIVIDSTDPIGPAVGLFQREFYGKVARALKPGGVMAAQTESPHWGARLVGPIYREIEAAFKHVHPYLGAIPTYPSGLWCWAYASNDRTPATHFDSARAKMIAEGCLYYNPGLQSAAFALPTFAAKAIAGENVFARFDPPTG